MITKNTTIDKIEIVGEHKHVQVKQLLIISENGQEISRNAHRYFLTPDMDISEQPQEVKDICNTAWTDEIKSSWNTFKQEQIDKLG